MKRFLVLITVAGVVWSAAEAADHGGISVQLTASRIVAAPNGSETRQVADVARPGEVIEYSAVYTNTGVTVVKGVAATLPIPATGLEYLPDSAAPKALLASLDGKTFAPVPLMRAYRLKSGEETMRPVPTSEYRFLRWELGDLAGGANTTVTARMRITDAPALSAASR